jgi:opacity protein-like surface antigen
MRKNIIALISVAGFALCAPAQAQLALNSIGPSVAIGSGQTNFGIDGKFGIGDNVSLRPFVYFPSGGTDFGGALTYDFKLLPTNNLQITPFAGASIDVNSGNGNSITSFALVGGADIDVTDSMRLKAGVAIPLTTNSGQASALTLSAGLRF